MNALAKSWAIAKKDIYIYYLKGPVLIFGIFFPTFLFLAFAFGRSMPPQNLAPGLIALALFFTASATTPAVLPFETRTRTLERLLAAPLTVPMIMGGDVVAAFLFGLVISLIPIMISLIALGASLHHPILLAATVVLSALCFAILGTLFSAPPTDNPSSIMTISNLVRLPLIFVSGVFMPLEQMPSWGQRLAMISPLTYTTELIRHAFGETGRLSSGLCLVLLALFALILWLVSLALHQRTMSRRLWV